VSGAVFDADGDRFYRLDYHPFRDEILVLSGDETAFMQAQYLINLDPARYKGATYINTVESDLNAGVAAENMGFKLHLAAVGDKWILLRIATLIAESRLKSSGNTKSATSLKRELSAMRRAGILDAHQFCAFENKLDRLGQKQDPQIPFAVGSEETGHNITLGWLDTENGKRIAVFFGNGLKSALNTFSATTWLTRNKSVRAGFAYLERPFIPGFKRTYYVYYVRKELFYKDSALWKQVKRKLFDEAKKLSYLCRLSVFKEDPDMLYVALKPQAKSKSQCAGIFVRNSGTENKIGVNLRCGSKDARKLQVAAERITHVLLASMKDRQNHLYKMERSALLQLKAKPQREHEININTETRSRVLHEMKKQDLIRLTAKGFQLSPKGKWYISLIDAD
jgi:phosphomannomutase